MRTLVLLLVVFGLFLPTATTASVAEPPDRIAAPDECEPIIDPVDDNQAAFPWRGWFGHPLCQINPSPLQQRYVERR